MNLILQRSSVVPKFLARIWPFECRVVCARSQNGLKSQVPEHAHALLRVGLVDVIADTKGSYMTIVERAPELCITSDAKAELVVSPSDITFHDLKADTVEIRVKVRNEGERRSNPTLMRLESAAFGAFVPGRPLATLPVPALEPGESREFSVKAARPHPIPLGDFGGVPPMSILTALNASPDEPPQQPVTVATTPLQLLREQDTSNRARKDTTAKPFLPPDLWDLFGREQPHWAGNINVFVGNCAVERHVARALRIYSGRPNLAMFIVGGPGKRDAYAFELVGLAPDWKAVLHDVTGARTLVVGDSDTSVQERKWVEARSGFMMVVLAVRPPAVCENGNLQVCVTRRSNQKTAVVEFDLDPTAQGAGCYVA